MWTTTFFRFYFWHNGLLEVKHNVEQFIALAHEIQNIALR